jgi:hypothetical protein
LGIIAITGFIQSLIAWGQFCGWAESNHNNFPVTGSFKNPAPLAGYIGACLILIVEFMSLCYKEKNNLYPIDTRSSLNIGNYHPLLFPSRMDSSAHIPYTPIGKAPQNPIPAPISRSGIVPFLLGSPLFPEERICRRAIVYMEKQRTASSYFPINRFGRKHLCIPVHVHTSRVFCKPSGLSLQAQSVR